MLKIILIPVVLCVVSTLSIGCASKSDSVAVPEDQVVTVQRGDLTVDVTAVGNLVFSDKEELTFEVSGTVDEVLVEAGDSVEEGQVLVKLDTSEWEEQLTALERNLTAAERQLAAKECDLLQAEINLKNAQVALDEAQLKWFLYTQKQLEIKELQVELAEMRLENTQDAIEDAQQTVADAQKELDEAKTASPVIIAPFAGLVTRVNVSMGDVVNKERQTVRKVISILA